MKELIRASALALAVWAASGPALAEEFVLYEDFSSATLDPARWQEGDRSRVLTGTKLRMLQRDWSSTASDSGSTGVSWTESLARVGPVTQLRASVKVVDIGLTTCGPNPSTTEVRARLMGTFFNSGNRAPGSNAGDVLAQIWARRISNSADAQKVLRVQGWLGMCTTSDCSAATQIGTTVDLGTVKYPTAVTLQIDWDRKNKQFLFSRDGGAATALAYAVDDSADPGNPFKSVGTRTVVPNCASEPRAYGYIDAQFDNVAVNKSAKP